MSIQNLTDQKSINVLGDEVFEDLFINLFSNSVRYTENSDVLIELVISDIIIGPSRYYVVTVADHGKGIMDDRKKQVFERFYASSKGSGLGLSLVRSLVERYKGKLWMGDRIFRDYSQGIKLGMLFRAVEIV